MAGRSPYHEGVQKCIREGRSGILLIYRLLLCYLSSLFRKLHSFTHTTLSHTLHSFAHQDLKSWRLRSGCDDADFTRRTSLDNSALERDALFEQLVLVTEANPHTLQQRAFGSPQQQRPHGSPRAAMRPGPVEPGSTAALGREAVAMVTPTPFASPHGKPSGVIHT